MDINKMVQQDVMLVEDYQVYMLPNQHDNRFMGLDWWEKRGDKLTLDQYTRTYQNKIEVNETCGDMTLLDKIYRLLNLEHPEDYKLPSLSVGDVIEVRGNYYFCDSIGWKKVDLK